MDIKRLQRVNREFERRVTEAEPKRLKADASSTDETIEASQVKQVELELAMEQLTFENKD